MVAENLEAAIGRLESDKSPTENEQAAESKVVRIVYTNYRNETATRTVIPARLWFGSTSWHPEPQWLMDAFDVDKGEHRSFAVADIKSWSK